MLSLEVIIIKKDSEIDKLKKEIEYKEKENGLLKKELDNKKGESNNQLIRESLLAYKELIKEHEKCQEKIKILENSKSLENKLSTGETQVEELVDIDQADLFSQLNKSSINIKKTEKQGIIDNDYFNQQTSSNNESKLKLNIRITEFHGREDEIVKD